MDGPANPSRTSVRQNVILVVAFILLCRAMWKFLKRVDGGRDDIAKPIDSESVSSTAAQQVTTTNLNESQSQCDTGDTPPAWLAAFHAKKRYRGEDERDTIQKKTFTKWVNKHLIKSYTCLHVCNNDCDCDDVTKGVVDLFEDLRDGNNLISLLEILSGDSLPREKGKMRVHYLQNVQIALKFLRDRNIKLVNIRPDDIVDGNPKLTLGLIWTIILHFQLSDIILYDDTISFKEALLKWARKTTEGYPDVNITDFTHSWRDGLAFNAILHRNRPDLLDYRSCRSRTARQNLDYAFTIAERDLGVTKLLDPEDVDCANPDEKSLITYISSLYELFPEPPENNPLLDKERIKKIEEYKKLAENLVKWLKDSCERLNDRNFPPTLREMQKVQDDTYRFRSEEIPPRYQDKQLLVNSYKDILKMALALPVRIEDEFKADNIEAHWKKMLQAYQERDRDIKDYMSKLEDLEHVAEKLRKNIRECDKKLTDIELKIVEEQKRILQANADPDTFAIEQINKELKFEEERINMMFKDAKYLCDHEYPKGRDLYNQVQSLQQRHAHIYAEFQAKILDALEDRSIQKIHQIFADYISALLQKLQEKERIIVKRLHDPIPRKMDDVRALVLEHKEFEVDTKKYETDIEKVKREFANLPSKNSVSQSMFDTLMDTWNKIWNYSKMYLERLKSLEIVLMDVEDASHLVSNLEVKLSKASDMPAEIEHTKAIFEDLKSVYNEVQRHTVSFEKLLSNVSKVRKHVERSRVQQATHPDVDRLENDVKNLHQRWDDIAAQVVERLKSIEGCAELLRAYRTRLDKEVTWIKKTNHTLDNITKRKELLVVKQLYEEISSHKVSIEDTNAAGARFIKEAKIYDLKLKNYREKLEEYHPSIDASAKRSKIDTGIDVVERELRQLNEDYAALLNRILALMNQLQDDDSKLKEFSETLIFKTYEDFPGINNLIVRQLSSTSSSTSASTCVNNQHSVSDESGKAVSIVTDIETEPSGVGTTNGTFTNGTSGPREIRTKVQVYHQKYTTATGSSVPLNESHYCASSIVSTVNLTQNIKSQKKDDCTEITINRVYETDVKNNTYIVKANHEGSLVSTREAPVQQLLADRLSEHEEYDEVESLDGLEDLSNAQATECQSLCDRFDSVLSAESFDNHMQVDAAVARPVRPYSTYRPSEVAFMNVEKQLETRTNENEKLKYSKTQLLDETDDYAEIFSQNSAQADSVSVVSTSTATAIAIPIKQQPHQVSSLFPENMNLAENRYIDTISGEVLSLTESIKMNLVDFALTCDDGHTYLISECIEENNLIRLPGRMQEMSLAQMVDSVLESNGTVTIIDKQTNREHEIHIDYSSCQTSLVSSSTFSSPIYSFAKSSTLDSSNTTNFSNYTTNYPLTQLREDLIFSSESSTKHEIADKLLQWLAQKEKMIAELGPICSEPRALATQLQQVQRMKEDFAAQDPVLSKMDKLGDSLLERLDRADPEFRRIVDKKEDIHGKWHKLANLLEERERSLLAVKDAASDFQNKFDKLNAALHKIADDFNRITSSGADNDEQLLKLTNLEENLENQRPNIADCDRACEKLCDLLTDSGSKNEVRNRAASLRKLYDDLSKQINDKKAELQSLLKEDKDFFFDCDAMQEWLRNMQNRLSRDFRVSAILEKVTRQVDQFEPLYREVQDKEHEIHILIQKANQLQRRLNRTSDINTVKSKIESIKRQWDTLKEEATNQHTKLQKCLDISTKYNEALNNFVPWLNQMENKIKQMTELALSKPHVEKVLREFQQCKNEIERHASEFENVCSLGETLIKTADIDTEVIRDQVNDLKRRWSELQKDLESKLKDLEALLNMLNNYNDKARDLNHGLNRLDDKLNQFSDFGEKDPKQLEKLKGLLDESKNLGDQLDKLKALGFNIIDEAGPNADSRPIRDELKGFDDRYQDLNKKLEDCHRDLEKASSVLKKFNEDLSAIQNELSALEEKLDRMAPIGRTIKVVQMQIEEMAEFNQRLAKVKENLKDSERHCNDIIQKGFTNDPKGLKGQLDSLNRKYERIDERSKTRVKTLETVLEQLKNCYKLINQNLKEISELLREVENFKPISRDVETIRSQQREFQNFMQRRVEPLSVQVNEATKLGNDLVQSAAHGVNTSELEHDLEKHGDKWNDLKSKLSERERKLDLALLQAGRFKDALNSVEKWLSETEEMVANQKPPSSDYIALKAQLQEQKYLIKMLTDRQQSIDSLQELGKELMSNLDRSEREQIDKQLADIKRRFNKLMDHCSQRMKILEDALPVVKEFSEKIVPLQEWLEAANRKLSTLQSFSIEPEKLNRRIAEHQNFHQDVVAHQRDFKDLSNLAQKLIYLIRNEDEGKLVTGKLSEVIDKYAKLVENSESLRKLLNASLQEISQFMGRCDKMAKWIADCEAKLDRYKVLSIHFDKLKDQNSELQSIVRDINSYQTEVNELVTHGHLLVKQYSSNDSLFVRQKVEAIQSKFNDLRQRANDKLDHAKASLALAEKFYVAHDQLNEWMDVTEKKLQSLDSRTLAQQNEIIISIESEVPNKRRLLDTINNLGAEFARTSPGQGSSTINGMVTKCNRRFDSICDQLQRRSERVKQLMKQNETMGNEVDELLDWFRDAERQLLEAEPIVPNYDDLLVLLRETKSLNDDINTQKTRVREVIANVKRLMRDSANDELAAINNKTDDLKELANRVSQLCQDRLNAIEHALPLVEHFFDTHNEIVQFLDDCENEVQMLAQPSIYAEQIRKQQEATKRLMQALNANKSLLERLNKTGSELIKLLQRKQDAHHIQQIMDSDNERYNRLKKLLRDRENDLENALQATSLFSDKLDGMLNALNNTADQLKNAEPISAHVNKIKEQICDNNAILDDLKKREGAFNAVKANAKEVISKAGKSDEPAIRDIRNKLDKLNDLWNDIHRMANERGDNLDEAFDLAKKFWNDLANVMRAIKELEDTLNSQEPPALEPSQIQHQQDILLEIKRDMDQTKPEVENCKRTGKSLMKVCGEPDRPDVRKHIEDLDNAWENVTSLYAQREQNLIDAMEKAMNFHEKLQNLLEFLDNAEDRFSKLGPIASDIDEVKRQIVELKNFKNYVDPHMIEVEALNRMAHELLDHVPSSQAKPIREAVNDINARWKDLLKGISDRQSHLDNALLKLGQFQHALNELLAWIAKIEKILDDAEMIYADPQVIEVELAKHKVLMNDISAHQASVDSLNHVGKQLMDSEIGSENARNTKNKLENLNKRWNVLIDKADKRNHQLEECLRKSQNLAQEIQDMLQWLNEIDQQISTSKPVGGLPETAREQLNRFMEIYNELDMNRHRVETTLNNGDNYVSKAKEGAAVHLQNNLKNLRTKWENVLSRANDRKIKLEIALKEATEFHEALQEFVDWLTSAEKYLNNLQPVSRVLEHVLKQIEEHKQFQKDIGLHRETMLNLDKKGTHLKYFSQKQDVILIKNLLSSVQHRWEKVLTKTAERARNLDHGFKEAKEFYDSWSDLISWLDDAEKTLDSIQPTGNNPDLIKQTLYRHKEFQRQLGAKQSSYDSTMRFGKGLKEKAPKNDIPILQDMLEELKNKWNAVCNKSVDKQRKLEEALLFSGQFKDAILALIEWLEKAKQLLAFDQPVHGDLDTVNSLIDEHKNFIEDFKSRENNMQFVRRTANDLMKSANPEDARQIRQQMETLEEKWSEIEKMIKEKQIRLDDALNQAEKLHQSVHALLEWLSDAEMKLRFAGPLPEDESATRMLLGEHETFLREMQLQERSKNSTLELAQEILQKCHPNAIPVVKHWITIIQSRWDEVESWAQQRSKRLNDNLKSLKDASELLDELQGWLSKTEGELSDLESQPLPDDVLELEKINEDHQRLIDELNDKKVDVEHVIKTYSSKKPQPAASKERSRRIHSTRSGSTGKSQFEPELRNPKAKDLLDKWHSVWKLASERMKRIKDNLSYNREVEKMRNFDFDDWRKRFLFFHEHKKAKMLDFFRRLDKDSDGRVTKTDFIDGVLNSRFSTNRLEMESVADIFDTNGDRYIDQKEYMDTLRPDKEGQPKTESEIIQDEVQRQVGKCTCLVRYKVYQVGEGKYRFGDSQKLRLVRILRSTVMVRVGGGWVSLEEFLQKNDPCRAKGRTNVELREQFVLADGVSQSMSPFKSKSPFQSDGTISLTGPISKIREKTERSIPMSQGYRFGSSTNDNASDQEELFRSRSRTRLTPSNSRPNSRPSSRAGSRQSSQPPSRAASDLSSESLDGIRRSTRTRTSQNGLQLNRTPSFKASSSSIGPRWK